MRIFTMLLLILLSPITQAEVMFSNSNGTITLVEYFDYNCPVCRAFTPSVYQLAANNPNLKVIQRVVPVLNDESKVVDSIVLASYLQGKFNEVEATVLNSPAQEGISFDLLVEELKTTGVNMAELNHDMASQNIQQQLNTNLLKYHALNVHHIPVIQLFRTDKPAYVIQYVGSQSLDTLQNSINLLNQSTNNGENYVK
jgi:protein-disulfide isomerase